MQNTDKFAATGLDGHLHIRATSDLMPRLHAVARRKGLTAAAWTRMTILDALDRAEYRPEAT